MIPPLPAWLLLHTEMSDAEWLATAKWAGVFVLATVAVAGGLILARNMARARAGRTRPCPECGRFFDPEEEKACPICGRRADAKGPGATGDGD